MKRYIDKISKFAKSFRPSFKPISSFTCNGGEYTIEGKQPGILSRESSYYFRVRTSDEEVIREVFRSLGMQSFMSKNNRVKSNKFSIFKIDKEGYETLVEQLDIIAPQEFKPLSSRGLKMNDDVFDRYYHDVMGIPSSTFVSTSTSKIPPELKVFKNMKKGKKGKPFDITKKSTISP